MKRAIWFLSALVVSGVAFAWYLQASRLYIHGSLASSNVFQHDGVACVPIKDVASALHLRVQRTSRGYELSDAGGANQADGIPGKVGEILWNGYVRFEVSKIQRGKEYRHRYSGDNELEHASPGKDIVVLLCRITNGMREDIVVGMPAGDGTGLADTEGNSYGPLMGIGIDVQNRAQRLLQGASASFGLRFEVPEQAKLQDVVFVPNLVGVPAAGKKKFRVSLGE